MDESSLQELWQEQPVDRSVPSELALSLTMVRAPVDADFARPTTHFRAVDEPKRRWPLLAFGALAASLISLSVYSLQLKIAPRPAPTSAKQLPRPVPPPEETREDMLAECRTYSNPEAGMIDWPRARTACNRALELEPIHAEANELVRRIDVLQSCESDLKGAKELIAQGRVEAGLQRLGFVHKGCESYLLKALIISREHVGEVKAEASSECLAYAKSGKWDVALPRCEVYARLACQTMTVGELYPPASLRTKLRGSFNPKTDWRPSDTVYVTFLEARERLKLPVWQCPELVAFRQPPPPPDFATLAKEELAKRYGEPELGRALVLYFQGDFQSAPVPLQKVMEHMGKAQHHAQAKALLLDMNTAINLFENGNAELLKDAPDRAAAIFREALEVDARLVLGESTLSGIERKRQLDRRQSYLRKNIVESMSSSSYEKGKTYADRKDFRGACRTWKLGAEFSRSNIDLLKALTNVCTRRAQEAIERAETCEQLRAALDFAVDGDGFKERVGEQLKSASCR